MHTWTSPFHSSFYKPGGKEGRRRRRKRRKRRRRRRKKQRKNRREEEGEEEEEERRGVERERESESGNKGRNVTTRRLCAFCKCTCKGLGVGCDISQLGKLAMQTNSLNMVLHSGSKFSTEVKNVAIAVS